MGNAALHPERGDVLEPYIWRNRVLLLFAPRHDHPELVKLRDAMERRRRDVSERDLVIVDIAPEATDSSETAFSAAQEGLCARFEVNPRSFCAVLIGKDGSERSRYTSAVEPDVIFERIDAQPRRKEEIEYRQMMRDSE